MDFLFIPPVRIHLSICDDILFVIILKFGMKGIIDSSSEGKRERGDCALKLVVTGQLLYGPHGFGICNVSQEKLRGLGKEKLLCRRCT